MIEKSCRDRLLVYHEEVRLILEALEKLADVRVLKATQRLCMLPDFLHTPARHPVQGDPAAHISQAAVPTLNFYHLAPFSQKALLQIRLLVIIDGLHALECLDQ